MSRIGLNPVSIPEGVSVNVNGSVINVKVLRVNLIRNLILTLR